MRQTSAIRTQPRKIMNIKNLVTAATKAVLISTVGFVALGVVAVNSTTAEHKKPEIAAPPVSVIAEQPAKPVEPPPVWQARVRFTQDAIVCKSEEPLHRIGDLYNKRSDLGEALAEALLARGDCFTVKKGAKAWTPNVSNVKGMEGFGLVVMGNEGQGEVVHATRLAMKITAVSPDMGATWHWDGK